MSDATPPKPHGGPPSEPPASDAVPGPFASGPAFPLAVKALATLVVLGLLVAAVRAADRLLATTWSAAAAAFMLAALGVVGLCYYWILASRTSIDATTIRQTWIWNKQVAIAEIRDVRFIYLPHLAWLVAPRLVVRAQGAVMLTFHAADREVLRRFATLRFGPIFAAES